MTPAPRSAIIVRRGQVWWVDFDPARGSEIRKTRPAIVLTANPLNRVRRTVIVVPLSSKQQPRLPLVVPTPSVGRDAVAICDQMRAVDRTRLRSVLGTLHPEEIKAIEDAVRSILRL